MATVRKVGGNLTAASLLVKERHAAAIGPDQRIDHAVSVARGLDQHRAGTVAEQDTGGAIGVVDDRRHLSAPTTITLRARPVSTNWEAIVSA